MGPIISENGTWTLLTTNFKLFNSVQYEALNDIFSFDSVFAKCKKKITPHIIVNEPPFKSFFASTGRKKNLIYSEEAVLNCARRALGHTHPVTLLHETKWSLLKHLGSWFQ